MTPPIEVTGSRSAVELCARAEELGYTDVWTAEVGGADAFAPLAAVAQRTERIRLGTALVPVFTRLRHMLAGRKASYRRRTLRVDGFRLQIDPEAPVPIYVGALGPRMCRLAGRVADGVQFFLMTPLGVRRALEEVAAGARQAGRDPASIDVFIRLPACLGEPTELVRFMARRLLAGYAMVPAYNVSLSRQGFGGEARVIAEKWAAGDRDGAPAAFTDEMLEELFLMGDPVACRTKIEAYRMVGVTTPVLMAVSFAGTMEERAERVEATC